MGVICTLSTGKWRSDKRGDLLTPCTLSHESCKAASMWLSFVCGSKWFRFINVSRERPCEAGGMVMNAGKGGMSIDIHCWKCLKCRVWKGVTVHTDTHHTVVFLFCVLPLLHLYFSLFFFFLGPYSELNP